MFQKEPYGFIEMFFCQLIHFFYICRVIEFFIFENNLDMKKHNLLTFLVLIFIYSCEGNSSKIENNNSVKIEKNNENIVFECNSDTVKANFKEFRDALYSRNLNKLKSFFEFPVITESNGLWYKAYMNVENIPINLENATPFNEKDFDKNFDKILDNNFIKDLIKVKTDSLFSQGKYETPKKYDKNTFYYMEVVFDKKSKVLIINQVTGGTIAVEDGEGGMIEEENEGLLSFQFRINDKNKLIFKDIVMAG